MTLSTQQSILVEQRLNNEKKSVGIAYLLWFLLGGLGAHRFYLGQTGSAVTILILSVLGWATVSVVIGIALLIAVVIWLLIDAFLIPRMVEQNKNLARMRIANELSLTAAE